MNLLSKFKLGINKSSNYITNNVKGLIKNNQLDVKDLEILEEILISADLGVDNSKKLINTLRKKNINQKIDFEQLKSIISKEIELILLKNEKILEINTLSKPDVYIFIGVNGSGKTTTIGKLAKKISGKYSILIAACDTFRAGAVEQLETWALRSKIEIYKGKNNQDPASVAFEAVEKAKKDNTDVLFIDTAGRLSNNLDLMSQLEKMKRVINKSVNEKNINTHLILDASTGNNILNQFEKFNKSIGVNGLIITKLDGTAKGGSIISVASKHSTPIYFLGMGEGIEDLHTFKAKEFSLSLFNLING